MEEINKPDMDMAAEPLLMPVEAMKYTRKTPTDLDAISVENDVLLITPDIEQEIEDVDRGEVVSMSEFKTIFAKWID